MPARPQEAGETPGTQRPPQPHAPLTPRPQARERLCPHRLGHPGRALCHSSPGHRHPFPEGPESRQVLLAGAEAWTLDASPATRPALRWAGPLPCPQKRTQDSRSASQCDRVDEVQKCVLGEKGARGAFSEASDSRVPAAGGRGGRGLGGGVLRDAAAASRALAEPVPGCRGPSSRQTAAACARKPRCSRTPQAVSTPGDSRRLRVRATLATREGLLHESEDSRVGPLF